MRKFACGLLLLSFVFALACTSSNTGTVVGDKENRWVSIVVYRETDAKPTAKVFPKFLRLIHQRHKLHFVVYNNLEEGLDVKTVDIDFGANAPFDDGLKKFAISNVASGFSGEVEMKLAKDVGSSTVTYDYTVNLTLSDGTTLVADPQVEISGGRVNVQTR